MAKIIGIIIIVIGFLAFTVTTFGYEDATKKMGLSVLTSSVGKQTLEYWIGEAVFIVVGLTILVLGIRFCRP